MDFEMLNEKAYQCESVPEGSTPADRMAFLSLRLLYVLHSLGAYTREQGSALKGQIACDHQKAKQAEEEQVKAAAAWKLMKQRPELQEVTAYLEGEMP